MPTKKAAPKKVAVRREPTMNTNPPAAEPAKAAKPKYADDDTSIDARMWRLEQDHIRMGARPKA